MWGQGWREQAWQRLSITKWDVVVVGGGITGAGIVRAVSRLGLKCALLEQGDFASGTSSRSSKLVHGGLRYLKEGQWGVVRESVQERDRLLREVPGLVDPVGFLIPVYKGGSPNRWIYKAALSVYDVLGNLENHTYLDADSFRMLVPFIKRDGLQGGFRYPDAQTDDARLVLRLLREANREGATVVNYTKVDRLLRHGDTVSGVVARDVLTQQEVQLDAKVVINATGAWSDALRHQLDLPATMRPLRGSHLIFSHQDFPLFQAIAFPHPDDKRLLFAVPWEGATLLGTTDLDHTPSLDHEPRITRAETDYLLKAVNALAPSLGLTESSIISTFAGVRPIVGVNKEAPSHASREFVLWQEQGLFTVTGGKLTTFSLIARDVVHRLQPYFPALRIPAHATIFSPASIPVSIPTAIPSSLRKRLIGRYGPEAVTFFQESNPDDLTIIPGTDTTWAEVRWAARHEGVIHLTDLLLRRVRIGLLLPEGARGLLPRVKPICESELGWDEARWAAEVEAYLLVWHTNYTVPGVGDAG